MKFKLNFQLPRNNFIADSAEVEGDVSPDELSDTETAEDRAFISNENIPTSLSQYRQFDRERSPEITPPQPTMHDTVRNT